MMMINKASVNNYALLLLLLLSAFVVNAVPVVDTTTPPPSVVAETKDQYTESADDSLPLLDKVDSDVDEELDDSNNNNNADVSDDDNGKAEEPQQKGKQQLIKALVEKAAEEPAPTIKSEHPTPPKKPLLFEAKYMVCSIVDSSLVCSSVDLSKIVFEPTECSSVDGTTKYTVCKRALA